MLADEPGDTFLRYSLALELEKEGNHPASIAQFEELTRAAPPYVPAFFMLGQQLVKLSRIDEARDVLRAGIDVAREQANSHAAGEMAEFLASLGR